MRFRLWTLLVLTAPLAVFLGWFANRLHQARRQERAISLLEAHGAEIYYDYEIDFFEQHRDLKAPNGWSYSRIRQAAKESDRSILTTLLGKNFTRRVTTVFVEGLSHEDCKCFEDLPMLEVLGLSGEEVSDASLLYLKDFQHLRELYLVRTRVTQAALDKLSKELSLEVAELEEGGGNGDRSSFP